MASITLTISGMTCDHCRAKVESALKQVRAVYGAAVDLAQGVADVDFDDARASSAVLVEAVVAAGYGAQVQN